MSMNGLLPNRTTRWQYQSAPTQRQKAEASAFLAALEETGAVHFRHWVRIRSAMRDFNVEPSQQVQAAQLKIEVVMAHEEVIYRVSRDRLTAKLSGRASRSV